MAISSASGFVDGIKARINGPSTSSLEYAHRGYAHDTLNHTQVLSQARNEHGGLTCSAIVRFPDGTRGVSYSVSAVKDGRTYVSEDISRSDGTVVRRYREVDPGGHMVESSTSYRNDPTGTYSGNESVYGVRNGTVQSTSVL